MAAPPPPPADFAALHASLIFGIGAGLPLFCFFTNSTPFKIRPWYLQSWGGGGGGGGGAVLLHWVYGHGGCKHVTVDFQDLAFLNSSTVSAHAQYSTV